MGDFAAWCTNCGSPSRASDRFCESCGTQIDPTSDPNPTPATAVDNARGARPLLIALLSILLLVSVAAVVIVVAVRKRDAPTFSAATRAVTVPAPYDTVSIPPPTAAPWNPPAGFVKVPGHPAFAYNFLEAGQGHCDFGSPCWNVSVISQRGCSYGITATLTVKGSNGIIVDSATDRSYGSVAPGQATLLKPENKSGQADVVGVLENVACFGD